MGGAPATQAIAALGYQMQRQVRHDAIDLSPDVLSETATVISWVPVIGVSAARPMIQKPSSNT